MQKFILGAATALAIASPAAAADLAVPRYSEVPAYGAGPQRYQGYAYEVAPPVVVEESIEEVPVVVNPPVVVEEDDPVYAAVPVYAYAPRGWHDGWRHRGPFRRW